jgi:hypothetical protein
MSGENPGEYWSSEDRHQESEVSSHLALVMTQAKQFPKFSKKSPFKAGEQSIVNVLHRRPRFRSLNRVGKSPVP